MSNFLAFTYNLVKDARSYVDARVDNLKLRSIKGLSEGTSSLASLLLIFIVLGAFVTVLSFALVLLLGELLNSYALGAFIMAGVLLLLLVILLLCRKRLFKDNFVAMYTDVFYKKEEKPLGLRDQETLDDAIIQTEMRAKDCFSAETMSENMLSMLLRFLLKKRK